MAFYVGQEVICVNDSPGEFNKPGKFYRKNSLHGLKKNRVYTVRGVGVDTYDDLPVLWLHEIIRPALTEHGERGFAQERFRPLKKSETDISVFEALLDTTKLLQGVDA